MQPDALGHSNLGLDAFLNGGYRFVEANTQEWKLGSDVDLEVTNHVLRVRIQDGTIADYREDVLAVCACQHSDGGWGNTRDDQVSRLRSTAFCTQMLLRANRQIDHARISRSVALALEFILSAQRQDGSWDDDRWHFLDATSVSVGTLLFAVNESSATLATRTALARGIEFIVTQRHADSLWYYKPTASPVTISAHLLQKCATYGVASPALVESARALLALQDPVGHWDRENIDHTCDASRCLMLVAGVTADPELIRDTHAATTRALSWILATARDGGLANRPGGKPHVERTCDGIDTVLKYRLFSSEHHAIVRFWR